MQHIDEEYLDKLQGLLQSRLTKKDFLDGFQQVINLVLKVQKDQAEAIHRMEETHSAIIAKIDNDNSNSLASIEQKLLNHVEEYTSKHTGIIESKMAEVKDGKDADEEAMVIKIFDQMKDQVSTVLDKPEDLRNKIETLEGENKLSISSIHGLKEALEALKRQVDKMVPFYVGTGTTKGVQIYDLSSQLNGVLKTFTLPALTRIVGIQSSSFPNAFRPTTDFTNTSQSITFTSEINAATVLAAGQTLIIQYVEA